MVQPTDPPQIEWLLFCPSVLQTTPCVMIMEPSTLTDPNCLTVSTHCGERLQAVSILINGTEGNAKARLGTRLLHIQNTSRLKVPG